MSRRAAVGAALCVLTGVAATGSAQAAKDAPNQPKFTTQVLIVPAFLGTDRGASSRGADIVRSRVAGAFPKSELKVISAGDMDDWFRRSGFDENPALSEGELKEMARKFRADERITGALTRQPDGSIRIEAALSLVRDLRLAQPIVARAASVQLAAEAVAAEAIAARRQLPPLRQCENFDREGNAREAAAAATTAIALYSHAVPARVCLLNALSHLEVGADSVIAVSRATLAVAPSNAVALEDLAQALDAKGQARDAAPVWTRLLATDSTSEAMIEKVVNALAREGFPGLAAPIIDRGTEAHPENLPLLKVRWLVHLADNDWKGAILAGEQMLAHDQAAQSDPDFYLRLATALRSDGRSERALGIAANAVARFPESAPLYVLYLQLLKSEGDSALQRGLAAFPDNAEVHVLAAQTYKGSGNSAAALAETKRALAVNPRLPHGYLQLAQIEIDAGETDSAFAAIELASRTGEDSTTVAQFALARGNSLFKAAGTSQKREDFQRALKFLTFAARIRPSPEAKFLVGASALSIGQSAATEAAPGKSCELSKLADSSLTEAEINLVAGGAAAPDAAKQYLDYVAKLRPYVADELKTFCPTARAGRETPPAKK
jgi:tetratricopeptide (TPR) repeat protein